MTPLLLALVLTAPPEAQATPSRGVYALAEPTFTEQAREDLRTLRRYADGLRRLQAQLKANTHLFHRKETVPYSPDQKALLLSTWGAFYSYVFFAEGIRQRYWDFLKELPPDGPRHALGYVVTHAALTTELAHGLTFADLTAANKQLEVLLDEPNAEFGIQPRAFADFKFKVIHVATTTQLYTGDLYAPQVLPALKKHGLLSSPEVQWALQETKLNSKAAKGKLLKRGINLFAKNAGDIAKDQTLGALFPVQKDVAEFMGDFRVKRQGKYLISKDQALELVRTMEPGDIMVARQNWYLSNIGLPGFWPHAELFLGTAGELAAYFDADEATQKWVASLPGQPPSFSAHLKARFPKQWAQYAEGTDYRGQGPIRIIEAISEGVSFTAVEHGMVVDYVAAMRPRLPKVEKAKAIARAFGYQGRPYDFNFDFLSDATLVCTELVTKSYAPSADMKGLAVKLVNVAGRDTLPANEIVRMFDAELDSPTRQLDFVGFLDGREKDGNAVRNTAEAFRKSFARVKWDVAQR